MYKNFKISDQEKKQIMEMHKMHGYKTIINEDDASAESGGSQMAMTLAQSAVDTAKSSDPDPKMKQSILDCIKNGKYTHLAVVTTGAGTYALGALAVLLASGVGTVPALVLMSAGAAILTIEGLLTGEGSGAGSVTDEMKQLMDCLKQKGSIK